MGRSTVGMILILACALLVGPLVSDAQQTGKVARIGYLSPVSPGLSSMLEAFQQGLGRLGWLEGKNLAIEYCWADGRLDQLPALAAELVRLKVEVIVTWGPGVRAAQHATGTIPIVIASTLDAVQDGVVASLARPGGNSTGLTLISTELMGKRLEFLKQAIPTLARVALLTGPPPQAASASARVVHEAERAAHALGLTLHTLTGRELEDVTSAFSAGSLEADPWSANARHSYIPPKTVSWEGSMLHSV